MSEWHMITDVLLKNVAIDVIKFISKANSIKIISFGKHAAFFCLMTLPVFDLMPL